MDRQSPDAHPLRDFFAEKLHETFTVQLEMGGVDDVERYLTNMLIKFLSQDGIYGIRDANGRKVRSVAEMIAEGDIRLRADSFAREREVHRHIGDFLLFWSGLFPEFLREMTRPGSPDALVDPVRQGQFSYYVASTFEHDPYGAEAPVMRKLSEQFEGFCYGLGMIRGSFPGLTAN